MSDKSDSPSWTERITKGLGLYSAVLGGVLLLFNVVTAGRNVLGGSKEDAERKAAAPRLTVDYVSIPQDLYSRLGQGGTNDPLSNSYFMSFPIMSNEVSSAEPFDDPDADAQFEYVTCLRLQNAGARRAEDVHLSVRRVELSKPLDVPEAAGSQGVDFRQRIASGATSLGTQELSVGDIDPGRGVFIPLFVNRHPPRPGADPKWTVASPRAFLPDQLWYMDGGRKQTTPVRAMHDPMRLADGIEGRG